jgi:hypothetical protein
MSKITLVKWVAGFDINSEFIVGTVNVRETPHRYIVIDDTTDEYRRVEFVIHYSKKLLKDELFDTKEEAIRACMMKWNAIAQVAKLDYSKAIQKQKIVWDAYDAS